MSEQTTHTDLNIDPENLDFASYRVSNSNHLSDHISLPLGQALAVIDRMWNNPEYHDSLLGVLENEIKDANQMAAKCQCEVEEGGAS